MLQLGRARQHFKQRHFPHPLLDPVAVSVRLPLLACDHCQLTATGGVGTDEAFARIPVQVGDHLLAYRGYFNRRGSRARGRGGRVGHRAREHRALGLSTATGEAFDLVAKVRTFLRPGQTRPREVQLLDLEGRRVPGPVCVLRETGEAIRLAHQGLLQEAFRKDRKVRPQTWESAKYVIVFTKFPAADFPAARVLEWCRLRGQIGLV